MKKIYLIGLLALGIGSANAQNAQVRQPASSSAMQKKEVNHDVPAATPLRNPNPQLPSTRSNSGMNKAGSMSNTLIGKTYIVNQTNNSPYRRVNALPGGKMSITWTASADNSTNGYLSRGSGYNHFNGTAWTTAPSAANAFRIETLRTGFPAIASAPNNAYDIIISHRIDTASKSQGLMFNRNQSIGNTTWTSTNFAQPVDGAPSVLWPRVVVSGDYMIVVANYTDSSAAQPITVKKNNVENPLVYSRYRFSTNTWIEEDMTFPMYDSTLMLEGTTDSYSIDANGNTVAVLVGGIFNSYVLWKSTDNGGSWTRTIIDTFPVRGYKFDRDTLPETTVNNGSVNVLVDNNGTVHAFSGCGSIKDSIMHDGFYTYSYSRVIGGVNDKILYWNDATAGEIVSIASALPTLEGDSAVPAASFSNDDRRYGISNSTWPSAGIDAQGRIFLTYSAISGGDKSTDDAGYRDILIIYSTDNGATWSTPQNLTKHFSSFREEAYPTSARTVNDKVHISYLKKEFPGSAIATGSNEMFEIYYMGVDVSQIIDGTVGIEEKANEAFAINQNYPNPFHGSTFLDVNFKRSTTAKVTVTDLTGKEVFNSSFSNVPAGPSTIELNVGEIPSGFYFYSIEAEGMKVTNKMMVN